MGWDGSGVLRGYMPKFGGNASLRSSVFFFLFFSPSLHGPGVCMFLSSLSAKRSTNDEFVDQVHTRPGK
jgi:hypothetical protein